MKSKNVYSLNILLWILFFFFTGMWVFLNTFTSDESLRFIFTSTYCLVALVGGITGIFVSKLWGGRQSKVGAGLLFISTGLLFQFFFQVSYSFYYYVLGIENAYPSIGDVFYVTGNLLFLFGLIKIQGIFASQSIDMGRLRRSGLILSGVLVLVYLTVYAIFVFDKASIELTTLQGWVILGIDSITFIGNICMFYIISTSFVASSKYLGGLLKVPTLLLLSSVLIFYVADIEYAVSDNLGNWRPAGFDDYLVFLAYFLISYALLRFRKAYEKLG